MDLEDLINKLNLTKKEIRLLEFVKEADEFSLTPSKDHTQVTDQENEYEKTILRDYGIHALRGGGELNYCSKKQVHGCFKQHYLKGYDLKIKIEKEN